MDFPQPGLLNTLVTGNPGKGIVAGDPDGAGPLPAQPEAIRDYEAIELTFNKRFSNNYSLRASYVYSSLTGNYSGLASSDEFGRTDPNVARVVDTFWMAVSIEAIASYVVLSRIRRRSRAVSPSSARSLDRHPRRACDYPLFSI